MFKDNWRVGVLVENTTNSGSASVGVRNFSSEKDLCQSMDPKNLADLRPRIQCTLYGHIVSHMQ